MKPNKWRTAEYTDDGCTIYQCLRCKEMWEARTSPHNWQLCPYCGAQWDGEQPQSDATKHRKQLRSDAYLANCTLQRLATYMWVIESAIVRDNATDIRWQYKDNVEGSWQKAASILAWYRKRKSGDDILKVKWRIQLVPATQQYPLP